MKKSRIFLGSEKGFSLIEVLFASAIILLLVAGFLGSATTLQFANEAAYQRSIALEDASRVIEQIRSTAASGTFPANVTAVYSNGGTVSGYSTLTNESVVVSYANAAANPLDVTVTVSYSENGTRSMTAALRTYITQRT